MVKTAGFKLAGTDGSMRLELPSHLLGHHRTLSKAGLSLRQEKPGMKTYVRFEDETMSLILDYKLVCRSWSRLRVDQVKEAIPAAAQAPIGEVSAQEFSELLSPASGATATPLSS